MRVIFSQKKIWPAQLSVWLCWRITVFQPSWVLSTVIWKPIFWINHKITPELVYLPPKTYLLLLHRRVVNVLCILQYFYTVWHFPKWWKRGDCAEERGSFRASKGRMRYREGRWIPLVTKDKSTRKDVRSLFLADPRKRDLIKHTAARHLQAGSAASCQPGPRQPFCN